MFNSAVVWLKGLSFIGKTVVGVVTIGTMSAFASTTQPHNYQVSKPVDAVQSKVVEETKTVESVKNETVTETVPFERRNEETSMLASGTKQIKQTGVDGVKILTYKVVYVDGKEMSRNLAKEEITTQPIDEVTYIGTYVEPAPRCDSNYSGGCVPLVGYDLDCGDIGFSVVVVGYDKHGFDRDRDGYGCESY